MCILIPFFEGKSKMTTWFTLLLFLIGILTAASVWAVNLDVRRFAPVSRLISMVGPIVLLGMFVYSIYFIKGANYSWLFIFLLSLVTTLVWIFAGGLLVGIVIILAVGGYWTGVTLRDANYAAFRRRFRRDFSYGWSRIKAWIEGEE